ncbi:hypothetical protein ACFQY0_09285 [Haloferula chungangensis]|uniref:TraB/GumN family protein n=1 Tax=Haloferula chungangensis TaxID=1048331 RepID=A0ABW2L4T4_9BACT
MKRLLPLLTACFLPSTHAEELKGEKSVDFIRVTEEGHATRLETAVTRFEKNGVSVELIGAIHLADASYFKALEKRFERYVALLYEGIGQAVPKPFRYDHPDGFDEDESEFDQGEIDDLPLEDDDQSKALDGLGRIYQKAARWLDLRYQMSEIDYTRPNFVHADLTQAEFRELQAERGESIIGFAFKTGFRSKVKVREPTTYGLIKALVKRDKRLLKLQLVHSLGAGDDQIAALAGENVIVTDRNQKCLAVLNEQIAAGKEELGIFYGAAHFPDMQERLLEDGWVKSGEEWMTAWDLEERRARRP